MKKGQYFILTWENSTHLLSSIRAALSPTSGPAHSVLFVALLAVCYWFPSGPGITHDSPLGMVWVMWPLLGLWAGWQWLQAGWGRPAPAAGDTGWAW
jgi:hypothetical protein